MSSSITTSKFLKLFSQLETTEQNNFKRYLDGLHHQKIIALLVFGHIFKYKPDYKSGDLEKEKAYTIIFEDKNFNYRKISDALSDLYLILEEYLLWKHFSSDSKSIYNDFILADFFKKKGIESYFFKKIKEIKKKLAQEEAIDNWHFLDKMRIYHLEYFLPSTSKMDEEDDAIKNAMTNLDLFYAASKLRYSSELLSREKLLQETHLIDLLKDIKVLYQKSAYKEEYFSTYEAIIQLIKYQDEEDYFKLKPIILNNLPFFKLNERRALLTYLINFTSAAIKKDNHAFIQEAFDLCKLGIEENIFLENGKIFHAYFNNMVNLACKLDYSFHWIESFIEDRKNQSDTETRKNAVDIANARLAFEQSNYKDTIGMLKDVKFSNSYYGLRARVLLLRSYYELDKNADITMDFSYSFEKYIRRNRTIGESIKDGFLNLIKAVRMLISNQTTDKNIIKKKIENLGYINYKEWVLEKLDTLK